jgi:hypothetical protein
MLFNNVFFRFLVIAILVMTNNAFAQVEDDEESYDFPKTPTSNFEEFREPSLVAPYIFDSSLNLEFNYANQEIQYDSESETDYGVRINYDGYLFAISGNSFRSIFGKRSSSYDYDFEYAMREFSVGVRIQKHDKFRLGTSDGDSEEGTVDPAELGILGFRDDITVKYYHAYMIYAFSPEKFSLKALSFGERQLESGGSWLASLAADGARISSVKGLRPVIDSTDETSPKLTDIQTMGLSLLGGYAYSFIFFDRWMASFGLFLGPSGQQVTATEDGKKDSFYKATVISRGLLSIGYQGETWFVGLFGQNTDLATGAADHSLSLTSHVSYASVGYRF